MIHATAKALGAMLLVLGLILLPALDVLAKPPANNNVSKATAVAVNSSRQQDTTSANGGKPIPSCMTLNNNSIDNDVWFTITGTGGFVTVDTFGSTFDTVLAAYDASGKRLGSEVNCNDDASGGAQSEVTFPTGSGATYYIQAATFGSGTGGGTLTLNVKDTVA